MTPISVIGVEDYKILREQFIKILPCDYCAYTDGRYHTQAA